MKDVFRFEHVFWFWLVVLDVNQRCLGDRFSDFRNSTPFICNVTRLLSYEFDIMSTIRELALGTIKLIRIRIN